MPDAFCSLTGDEEECWFPCMDFVLSYSFDILTFVSRLV